MKNFYLLIVLSLSCLSSFGQSNRIVFRTQYGDIKVLLYDFTPRHKAMLLHSINDSVYAGALFNRIINSFVVQGGEHDIDIAEHEAANPMKTKPRMPAEFDERAFHKIGALGAGRDDNPRKASFLNQLYFVVGKPISAVELDKLEVKKGKKFTTIQRKTYLKIGGQPRLDGDYTVFGEVYEGLDVLLKISKVKTDEQDYPLSPIKFELIELKEN